VRVFPMAFLVLTLGCGDVEPGLSGDGGDPTADAGMRPDGPDLGDIGDPFDPDHVMQVAITMDPGDWEELRRQTRSIPETLGGDCMAEPFSSPYTKFPASIVVDGIARPQVAIRKKGFLGSLSRDRPSLKLDLDEVVPGQRLGGLKIMVLNNSVQDPSIVRQCLAYRVFRSVGIPASRCSFAHVTLNGWDLGVYVHVEDLDELFLARHFPRIDGPMWEGTLSDFRETWNATFDEENDLAADHGLLDELTRVAALPDDQLVSELARLIDLDGFLTFWAAESLLQHWDGHAGNTNNFYLFRDPTTGLGRFFPWGTDQTMQMPMSSPRSVYFTSVLAQRLYLYGPTQTAYLARMRELAAAWDTNGMLLEIDRVRALITDDLPFDRRDGVRNAMEDLKGFVSQRAAEINAELDQGPPGIWAGLRGPFCLANLGHLTGTFRTSFDTAGTNPYTSGSGTLTATVGGTTFNVTSVGAISDEDSNDPNNSIIRVAAMLDNGHELYVWMALEDFSFSPGVRTITWMPTIGGLVEHDPETGIDTDHGLFGKGTITLEKAAPSAGAPVWGRFDVDLTRPPW
jgi:spore coat protein H